MNDPEKQVILGIGIDDIHKLRPIVAILKVLRRQGKQSTSAIWRASQVPSYRAFKRELNFCLNKDLVEFCGKKNVGAGFPAKIYDITERGKDLLDILTPKGAVVRSR